LINTQEEEEEEGGGVGDGHTEQGGGGGDGRCGEVLLGALAILALVAMARRAARELGSGIVEQSTRTGSPKP
jgi:hypothetical protein